VVAVGLAESPARGNGRRPARGAERQRRPRLPPTTRQLELDWIHHAQAEVGKTTVIRDRLRNGRIVRQTIVDESIDPELPSKIEGGRFRRTITTEERPASRGIRPWSDADIPHLVPTEWQGVRYDVKRGQVKLNLFKPDAVRIDLVQEGLEPIALTPTAGGIWKARLRRPPRSVYGKAYKFRVTRKNGTTEDLADPFADQTEQVGEQRISRFADLEHTWRDQRFRPPPLEDIVLYETHLPSLSRHPSSGVSEADRGTYRGAMSPRIVEHLKRLGVAVELMPVHASDGLMGGDWGYYTPSFRAMSERYAGRGRESHANRDLKAMIDTLRQNGMPVIFDVVYNHAGDLHVKMLGSEVMQRRNADGSFDLGSGVGPTVRSEHPVVRQMMIETLRAMVETYHVDGFRFDLGAMHDKATIVAIARALPPRIHLFAEPWAYTSKWGKGDLKKTFAGTRWAVWNDDFREATVKFITGRANRFQDRDDLKRSITGGHDWAARPQQSVNYFSSHDGTERDGVHRPAASADIVGGNKKRLFLGLVLTLFSQGVPMISEGSEFMHSKNGATNSYNSPEVNQLDWRKAAEHGDLVDATATLIHLRKALPHLKYKEHLVEGRDISWIEPTGYPERDNVNAIAYILRPPPGKKAPSGFGEVAVLTNGSTRAANFQVGAGWRVVADGDTIETRRAGIAGRTVAHDYNVEPGTAVILARDPQRSRSAHGLLRKAHAP
jgi:pullulanase